jgi:hypothetical protein
MPSRGAKMSPSRVSLVGRRPSGGLYFRPPRVQGPHSPRPQVHGPLLDASHTDTDGTVMVRRFWRLHQSLHWSGRHAPTTHVHVHVHVAPKFCTGGWVQPPTTLDGSHDVAPRGPEVVVVEKQAWKVGTCRKCIPAPTTQRQSHTGGIVEETVSTQREGVVERLPPRVVPRVPHGPPWSPAIPYDPQHALRRAFPFG